MFNSSNGGVDISRLGLRQSHQIQQRIGHPAHGGNDNGLLGSTLSLHQTGNATKASDICKARTAEFVNLPIGMGHAAAC
jgi:hypothetical protein